MKVIKLVLVVAILALLPAITWAAPGDPGTGIALTAHDFTQANNASTTAPVGLCTFCHTPHKAQTTLLLWNHTLSANTFTWSPVTSTTGGTLFPSIVGSTYNGPTTKCLSCHDGSVSIGDIAWFQEASHTGASSLNPDKHLQGDAFNVGFGGDMSGNHPVAMPYPYNGGANTYNGITTGSQVNLTEFKGTPAAGIRLFHDAGGQMVAGPAAGKSGIECSSCHDPHNGSDVPSTSDLFVRGNLTGSDTSYICLKCHSK